MNPEYALYIIIPMVVGYVGERYKDMDTFNYGMFMLSIFIALKFILFLFFEGSLKPDSFEIILGTSTVLLLSSLFHFQKVLRRKKSK